MEDFRRDERLKYEASNQCEVPMAATPMDSDFGPDPLSRLRSKNREADRVFHTSLLGIQFLEAHPVFNVFLNLQQRGILLVLFALMLAVPACAQTAAPVAKPAAPAAAVTPAPAALPTVLPLSATEQAAIGAFAEKFHANQKALDELLDGLPRSVAKKLQDNQQERDALLAAVHRVEAEVAAEHPGYHFDEGSGQIVRDAALAAKAGK